MENLLTQALIGLVFVLSIALWSKSASNASTKTGSISGVKKTKKKKKGTTSAPSANIVAPILNESNDDSSSAAALSDQIQDLKADRKHSEEVSSLPSESVPSGAKKGKKSNGKKMTLEDFARKTNEERVEELERMARGDAGDVDVGRDMIDKELQPEKMYKKVARIEPKPAKKIVETTAVDDGWENVSGRAKGLPISIASRKTTEDAPPNAWASSNPFALLPGSGADITRPVIKSNGSSSSGPRIVGSATTSIARTVPGAGEVQTKKQRQNAAKAQAKKQERDAAETERLARLAQHKKQVEGERMKEAFKKQSIPSAPFSVHRGTSNGAIQARASVNEKGSLVWE